jgi:hypothetical protein
MDYTDSTDSDDSITSSDDEAVTKANPPGRHSRSRGEGGTAKPRVVDARTLAADAAARLLAEAQERASKPPKPRSRGEHAGGERVRRPMLQMHIDTSSKTIKLLDFLSPQKWNLVRFYGDFICEFPLDQLRDTQRSMLEIFGDTVTTVQIPNLRFCHSAVHVMGTGGGKTVLVGYAATHFARTFTSYRLKPEHYAALKLKPLHRPQSKCVIVCVPTIALAHEVYTKQYAVWLDYAKAALGLITCGSFEKEAEALIYLPEFRWYYEARDAGRTNPLPSTMVKIIAGSTGKSDFFVNAKSNRDAAHDADDAPGRYAPALLIVATYEQLLLLLLKANKTHPAIGGRKLYQLIGCVIFDECHYITESDRSAALAILIWLRIYDICTNFLTATTTERFIAKVESLGVAVHRHETVRRCPRVSINAAPFATEEDLIYGAAEFGFGAYLTAVVTAMRSRTAIFIENKLLLKIALTVMHYYIFVARSGLVAGQGVPIKHHMVEVLLELARHDLSIQSDTREYGAFIARHITTKFSTVIVDMWSIGVVLVTADLSSLIRRHLSRMLSDPRVPLALVLATSALAEGVNIAHVRMLAIFTVAYQGRKILLTSVKVLQMLGRHDREDVGGVVCTPPEDTHGNDFEPMPSSVFFADILGGGIDVQMLNSVIQLSGMNFTQETQAAFDAQDVQMMYRACPEELIPRWLACVPQMTGYVRIPYYACNRLMSIPGFSVTRESVTPCLLLRVMKLFRQGRSFNMTVFAASETACSVLAGLPCFAQIAIIVVMLQLRQYPPSAKSIRAQQHKEFIKFAEARRADITSSVAFNNLYTHVKLAIDQIVTAQRNMKQRLEQDGWVITRYTASPDVLMALAVFVTDLTLAPCNWDGIVTEWAVGNSMFGGFFGNVDTLIDVLVDQPYLPVARAQAELCLGVARDCPPEAPVCTPFSELVLDATGRLHIACLLDFTVLCGNVIKKPRPYTSPFQTLNFGAHNRHAPYALLENRVLSLLVAAAVVIHQAFLMKRDKEEITFGEVRARFATQGSAVYASDVHMRTDFVECERVRLVRAAVERQVRGRRLTAQREWEQEHGPAPAPTEEEQQADAAELEVEIQHAVDAELEKSPNMKTITRPLTLDFGKRIIISPVRPRDMVIQFRGMMPSDAV